MAFAKYYTPRIEQNLISPLSHGALAEFERDLIRERTKAGLLSARQRGRLGGRPPVMDEKKARQAKAMLADSKSTVTDVCATLGVSRATLYRHLS